MALDNDADFVILGNDIRANTDPEVQDALAKKDTQRIAAWYNQQAVPDFHGLKKRITHRELIDATVWATDYAALKDDIDVIDFLFARQNEFDPTTENARNALDQAFTGATASKTAVLAVASRLATYAEKLFAVEAFGPGGGDGRNQNNSAELQYVGELSARQVERALNLTR